MLKKILLALLALVVLYLGMSTFYPAPVAKALLQAEYARVHLERKQLDTDGGLHWAYLEGGSGDPLVLVHGFGADKDNWTKVAEYLVPHYRVIAPDLQGFGESSKSPTANYTVDDQVETLRAFIQKLGLKQFSMGGSSMGGHISMAYAAKYPNEVKTLWLVGPAGVNTAPPSELALLLEKGGRNPLLAQTPAEFHAIFDYVMTAPPYVPGIILNYKARQRIANNALEQRIFKEIRASARVEDQIKGLATPARVLWGDKDRALHYEGAQIIVKLMPNASATIMPGIGHLPMLERPREAAEDYLKFRGQVK